VCVCYSHTEGVITVSRHVHTFTYDIPSDGWCLSSGDLDVPINFPVVNKNKVLMYLKRQRERKRKGKKKGSVTDCAETACV